MVHLKILLPMSAIIVVLFITLLSSCTAEEVKVTHEEVVVTDPSADSPIFKKIDDMTFIVTPGSDESPERNKRNAIINPVSFWPAGIIPYQIAESFNAAERRVILQAMKHWENYTCIRFRPRTTRDSYYVVFMSGPPRVCRSFIGRIDRFFQPQGTTLGPGCIFFPIVVHEIGHSIGFYHEHSREDRDQYIRVLYSNIQQGLRDQFNKVRPNMATTLNFGYDYASIMHYGPTIFANRPNVNTMISQQPNIHIGDARELSPLDIAKCNALYSCGPRDTHPPPSVVVPQEPPLTIPGGYSCGRVINVTRSGCFTSPGYPNPLLNQRCAFVLKAPEGFGFRINFPTFRLDPTPGCSEDFVQLYEGTALSPNKLLRYRGYTEGRICNEQDGFLFFFINSNSMTVNYQTNNRNIRSNRTGLRVCYDLRDIDECSNSFQRCHRCVNTPGSFTCECNRGYYHSAASNACYDVNECAFNNGGCEHSCTNLGGSYRCSCRSGFFLQTNGLSCGTSRPAINPQTPSPGTIIPKIFTSSPLTTKAPPTTQTPPMTQAPPTTKAPSTTQTPPLCGGMLGGASGTFTTPNWPLTYPFNFECEWNIVLPDSNAIIEISFDNDFGIAGQMPACEKDQLIVYDGENVQSERLGLFCHLTRPDPVRTTSNHATLVFRAGPRHGPTRHGFKATYRSISKPTSAPITLLPTTPSPTTLKATTAPPTTSEATTASPTTLKATTASPTTLKATTASPTTSEATTPSPTTFKATTASPSTLPPTTATPSTSSPTNPPVQSDNCGGGFQVLTASSGSIQSKGWPDAPYPININCKWTIQCPANTVITVSFNSTFRIAGRMPSCPKDRLKVITCGVTHGPYCHLTAPQTFAALNCNTAEVSFDAGSRRGATRFGFKLNYSCH